MFAPVCRSQVVVIKFILSFLFVFLFISFTTTIEAAAADDDTRREIFLTVPESTFHSYFRKPLTTAFDQRKKYGMRWTSTWFIKKKEKKKSRHIPFSYKHYKKYSAALTFSGLFT
jgi:hypothetical protein